ncbi:hypothetical protein [Anaeromyxobacter diazotrophicus]|uniref:Lipoprotein n=1 Tax=Anaeromyxobacter diazotrophicus TaxID=2590199 RepID=A0A7I9VLQ4_9BACT|nr:hypothetical protein [Anaeromyxobacter diazotrophicus]GEJ57343.1 hypothetical protein AMYX_20840 [Anaeromyxobacter diazotrophicus]
MSPRRGGGARAALLGLALAGACARSGSPAAGASAADAGSGDGGKGPGAPAELGPGGDTVWLATLAGPYADLAQTVAADPGGGTVVAAAQGTASGSDALTVLRLGPDGAVAERRTFGPAACSLAASVLGVAPDGTAFLLAATACSATVPGLGTGALMPSGTLLALAPGGGAGAAVPVAGGPARGGATDAQGRLAVLTGAAAGVAVLAADGVPAWQVAVPGALALAALPGGGVVVGAAPAGASPALVALDAAGAERWRRELPAGFDLRHLAALTDGAAAATGVLSGAATFGAGQGGAAGERRQVVLAVEPDGTPRTLAELADASANDPVVQVAALPHGRAVLFGFPGCDRLRGLTPQLEPVWARTLDAGCGAAALGAALTPAGQLVVVGAFRGQADFGGGHGAAAQGALQDGFVLGLAP